MRFNKTLEKDSKSHSNIEPKLIGANSSSVQTIVETVEFGSKLQLSAVAASFAETLSPAIKKDPSTMVAA